jgi:Mannitol repressor
MIKPPKPTDREASPRFKKRGNTNEEHRALFDGPPSPAEFEAITKEIDSASDRSSAILAVNYVHNVLRFMIVTKFIKLSAAHIEKLYDQGGPLNTFSQCIELAYAIGILNEPCYRDLHIIRKIRNHFAHVLRAINFDNPEIAKLISKLTYVTKEIGNYIPITAEEGRNGVVERRFKAKGLPITGNREIYIKTCYLVVQTVAYDFNRSSRPDADK